MFSLNDLIQAFDNNLLYAWELLYAEMLIENSSINTDYLRKLVILYSKGVQKCHPLQHQGESYFKAKINSLMGQRKVVQCLKNEKFLRPTPISTVSEPYELKRSCMNLQSAMEVRRREIEMRLASDIEESRASRVSKMLKDESVRELKLQEMVMRCLSSEEEKLLSKIEQRKKRASVSGRLAVSLKLQTSGISTHGEGIDSQQNLMLDGFPFLASLEDGDIWEGGDLMSK